MISLPVIYQVERQGWCFAELSLECVQTNDRRVLSPGEILRCWFSKSGLRSFSIEEQRKCHSSSHWTVPVHSIAEWHTANHRTNRPEQKSPDDVDAHRHQDQSFDHFNRTGRTSKVNSNWQCYSDIQSSSALRRSADRLDTARTSVSSLLVIGIALSMPRLSSKRCLISSRVHHLCSLLLPRRSILDLFDLVRRMCFSHVNCFVPMVLTWSVNVHSSILWCITRYRSM